MEKLLAALYLAQVGDISTVRADQDVAEGQEGLFSIALQSRLYILRAKNDDEANQWVSVLASLRTKGLEKAASKVQNPLHAPATEAKLKRQESEQLYANSFSSTNSASMETLSIDAGGDNQDGPPRASRLKQMKQRQSWVRKTQ